LAFPGGAVQMIEAWFDSIDRAMAAAFPPERISGMKIRERIRALVLFHIERARPHRAALPRALAVLALPPNSLLAARLARRAAARMWRLAGASATGFNHYSKRAILAGGHGATTLLFLDDPSDALGETRAFPARRIEGAMSFEKAKG